MGSGQAAKRYDYEFAGWEPVRYLQEYFPPDVDAEPIVKFITEEICRAPGRPAAIDVGCGPTVCYWSALAPYVSGIYIADYLDANLEQIRKWVNAGPDMYDWSSYTRLALKYNGQEHVTREAIAEREDLSRSKVLDYLHCDVRLPDPLGPAHRGRYECVVSICCADSITADRSEWRAYMKNILSLLQPGGLFIASAMRNCSHYEVSSQVYPAANIDETDFASLMQSSGFDPDSIRLEIASESRRLRDFTPEKLRPEYDELILASGLLHAG